MAPELFQISDGLLYKANIWCRNYIRISINGVELSRYLRAKIFTAYSYSMEFQQPSSSFFNYLKTTSDGEQEK